MTKRGGHRTRGRTAPLVSAVDLFCGAGGLSQGLTDAGIKVVAGVDIDPACAYPFEANIGAPFIERDVREITAAHLEDLWAEGSLRLLAGCAPCQPFSPYRKGKDTSEEEQWPLLREFARLVREVGPDIVTMENVPRIGSSEVFGEFVATLTELGYNVDWRSCYGPRFGLPQHRRRLVLVASKIAPLAVPDGDLSEDDFKTVRDTIAGLANLEAGMVDPSDPLHAARSLSSVNLERIRASAPGGTWLDWSPELRAPCHQRSSGSSFKNVYARMEWDQPAPTITTLAHNYGAGRFGHPDQDRALSLREAAMLQGFPRNYKFLRAGSKPNLSQLGRLIGNAVPPPIAAAVGRRILEHIPAEER